MHGCATCDADCGRTNHFPTRPQPATPPPMPYHSPQRDSPSSAPSVRFTKPRRQRGFVALGPRARQCVGGCECISSTNASFSPSPGGRVWDGGFEVIGRANVAGSEAHPNPSPGGGALGSAQPLLGVTFCNLSPTRIPLRLALRAIHLPICGRRQKWRGPKWSPLPRSGFIGN